MNALYNEFNRTPLWGQILIIIVVLWVGNYWMKYIGKGALSRLSSINGKHGQLLKRSLAAALLASLAVSFCIGSNTLSWGLYGRSAFVILTTYLTTFFSRYYDTK